jgi:Tfp pilus assembly protein PilF
MWRLFAAAVVLFCFVAASAGYGQTVDYFTAGQDVGTKAYLYWANLHVDRVAKYLREGRTNDALEELKYTLDRIPNHPQALMLLGSFFGNSQLAVNYYQQALKLYPQYALTHAQYGVYLVLRNQIDDGIAQIQAALNMDPKLRQGYVWLAMAYQKKGNLELARSAAERARELGYQGKIPGEGPER